MPASSSLSLSAAEAVEEKHRLDQQDLALPAEMVCAEQPGDLSKEKCRRVNGRWLTGTARDCSDFPIVGRAVTTEAGRRLLICWAAHRNMVIVVVTVCLLGG